MAQGRKYAALPDLDSAPDVYETKQDIEEARSRASTRSSRSSDYQETPEGPSDEISGIDRATTHPGQARAVFGSARVDTNGVDYSGNVANLKSYKVSRLKRKEEFEGFGAQSNGKQIDAESYEEKLARLRREVEEVKLEQARRGREQRRDKGDVVQHLFDSLHDLQDQLPDGEKNGAESVERNSASQQDGQNLQASPSAQDLIRQSIPDSTRTTRALSLAADLEARMAALETVLGIPALSLPNQPSTRPVIPQLQTLDRQLTILNGTTGPSLAALKTQVDSLTQSADALTTARKNAFQAKGDLRQHARANSQAASFSRPLSGQSFSHSRPSSYYGAGFRPSISRQATNNEDTDAPGMSLDQTAQTLLAGEETEQRAQVKKLHEQLSTIEALAPLVPGLLERVKSLHTLHADAAGAVENLEAVEKQQSEVLGELEKWRDSLNGLEERLKEGEVKSAGNRKAVKNWVQDLEERAGKLS